MAYNAAYAKKYRNDNRAAYNAYRMERRHKIRKWYNDYKAILCCSRCPENHIACIDFHHTDDNKEGTISLMVSSGATIERLQAEIAKCIVLCSNCHRKLHHIQKQLDTQPEN